MREARSWTLIPFEELRETIPAERFVEVDGQRIYVEDEGSGEPLLFLHGFFASSYSFRKIIPVLASGRRVVSIDLNGFGFTERPPEFKDYLPGNQVRSIMKVMGRLGIEEFSLVGHSYGGILGMEVARLHRARIRQLIMISPPVEMDAAPGFFGTAPGRMLGYGMIRGLIANPGPFRKMLGNSYHRKEVLTDAVAEEYRRRLMIEGLYRTFDAFTRMMTAAEKPDLDFAGVRLPVTVVAGKHDAVVDFESCRELAGLFWDARFESLENSGHSSPEEEPDEVASLIERALA